MGKVSQVSVARYGTPLSFRVTNEVAAALVSESKRMKRTVDHVASEILHMWYELDFLDPQTTGEKKATG